MTTFHLDGLAGTFAGRLSLRHITTLNSALGTGLPTTFTKELEAVEQNKTNLMAELQAQPTPAQMIEDAIVSGTPLLTNKNVTTIIAAATFNGLNPSRIVEDIHERRAKEIVTKYLPTLFAAWSKPVAEAGEAIAKAKRELPNTSLRAPGAAAKLTPSEFNTWSPGHMGVKVLDVVLATAPGLYNLSATGIPNPDRKVLVLAALNLDQLKQFHALDAANNRTHIEDLDGIEIALADPAEFKARLNAINAQIQAVTEAYDEKMLRSRKRETSSGFNESTRRAVDQLTEK